MRPCLSQGVRLLLWIIAGLLLAWWLPLPLLMKAILGGGIGLMGICWEVLWYGSGE